MTEDKVITLRSNEHPNLVSCSCLDDCNYLLLKGTRSRVILKEMAHLEMTQYNGDSLMTWLWNSVTLEISQKYMFYSFVHEIWENLIETYSMKKDFYNGTLNVLWIELDHYHGLKICKAYSIAYTRLIERGRIFKFLHGLNSKYDPIQVQILVKRLDD
ncbi:hypothetical protein CR513_06439, partial [Mucuna pruriens]